MKNRLFIWLGVALLLALGWYLVRRREQQSQDVTISIPETQVVQPPAPHISPAPKKTTTPKPAQHITTSNPVNLVKGITVLADNIKRLDGKEVYAINEVPVHDMKSNIAYTAKKSDKLGVVSYSRESGQTWVVYFIGKGGVKYWVTADDIVIQA